LSILLRKCHHSSQSDCGTMNSQTSSGCIPTSCCYSSGHSKKYSLLAPAELFISVWALADILHRENHLQHSPKVFLSAWRIDNKHYGSLQSGQWLCCLICEDRTLVT
jgi:hypothetical protein